MANQFPDIVPTGYAGDITDFRKTKVDRSGAMRLITGSVTVPAGTAADSIVGLFPFNAGAKIGYGGRVYSADLDTGTDVTLALGYYYLDSTATSDTDAFAAAGTAPQTAGMVEFSAEAGMEFTAAGDGWVVGLLEDGATTTSGDLTFSIPVAYDQSGVTN